LRWSWLMFVNTATSKPTPATRRSARACDDTSSTAAVQPRATACAKQTLQFGGFRGRLRRRQYDIAEPVLDGAEARRRQAGRPQRRLDEVGGRCLAARAGDTDHGQGLRRVFVERAGHGGDGGHASATRTTVTPGGALTGRFDDERGGPARQGLRCEVVPVGARFAALGTIPGQTDTNTSPGSTERESDAIARTGTSIEPASTSASTSRRRAESRFMGGGRWPRL